MIDGARTAVAPTNLRHPAARNRSRVTNSPAKHVSGRTAVGRRVRDLYAALMESVGNPTDVLIAADVLRVAELRTAAEDLRARVLAGNGGDPADLVRLENLAHSELR
jgi:hypothetical protein